MNRWVLAAAVLVMAIMGYRGIMLGDFAIDGPVGAIAGAVIAVVSVYAGRVLFSLSREMIAPYAKPRQTNDR